LCNLSTYIVGFFVKKKRKKKITKKKPLCSLFSFVCFRLFCTQVLFCMIFSALSSFISACFFFLVLSLSFPCFFSWWTAFSFSFSFGCCCFCCHLFNPFVTLILCFDIRLYFLFIYFLSCHHYSGREKNIAGERAHLSGGVALFIFCTFK
jgi:hypothetical protein